MSSNKLTDDSSDLELQPVITKEVSSSAASEEKNGVNHLNSVRCLCFDLSRLHPSVVLTILTGGVFVFFMANSYVEEYLFRYVPNFHFGWYFTFFELLCFSCFAIIERHFLGDEASSLLPTSSSTSALSSLPTSISNANSNTACTALNVAGERIFAHRADLYRHFIVGVCMTMSRGLTNLSLQYLNYPTQVIFKSMKLITVMIGSVFMLKQSYSLLEYLSAVCLVLSACLFSLGDVDVSSASAQQGFSTFGLIVVVLSLVGDALHSNTQESLVRYHHATTLEAMLFTNLFSAGLCFLVVVGVGELIPAYEFCAQYPFSYFLFVLRSFVIYGGVFCYVSLVKSFGAVIATGVTTIRKILTICASFLLFPKPVSDKYWWGGLAFFASITLSILVVKQRQQSDTKKKQQDQ